MSPPLVVAKAATHEGRSIIDSNSAIRFVLGFIAGGAGIDGTVVALAALSYEALLDLVAAEGEDLAFKRRPGESYANQASDMLLTMLGVYVGKYMKERWRVEEAARRQSMGTWPSTPQRFATARPFHPRVMQMTRTPSSPPVRFTRR